MATLKEALEYAAQNPDTDFATQLKYRIQSGAADEEASQFGIDLTPIKGQQVSETGELKEPRGFAGEIIPTLFSVGGALAGGVLGAPAGPAGIIAGGIAGAAGGGALGEATQQGLENITGKREGFDAGQVLQTGLVSGGLQALVPGGKAISSLGILGKEQILGVMKKLSGYADDIVEKAIQRTPGAVSAVQKGEPALVDVIKNTSTKLQKYALDFLKANQDKVAQLDKLSSGAPGAPVMKKIMLEEGRKFTTNITNTLRDTYKIGVDKAGNLLFNRSNLPSNIVSKSDQSAIQDAYNLMSSIKNNLTIKNIDAVLERMITLRSKTPAGTPTGGETRRIIGQMMDETVKFAESLGGTSKAYPEYANFLRSNLPERVFINEAKEMFGTSKLSAKQVSLVETRLLQLFNTGKLESRGFAEKVGEKIGEDIIGSTAGTLMKTGEQMSIRAQNLTKRGAVDKLFQFIPRAVIKNYVATGKMTGELSQYLEKPVVKKVLSALGITGKTMLQEFGNLIQEKDTGEEMKP